MQTAKVTNIKKAMYNFLQDRYPKSDEIIERICVSLQTDKDIELFMKMIVDCYEMGYQRSISDHKEQLAKLGLNVKIVSS